MPYALRISDLDLTSYSIWFRIYQETTFIEEAIEFTDLMVALYFGHSGIVKQLLKNGTNIKAKDNSSQTLLLQATKNGHKAVVKLLLDKGANVKAKGNKYS